MSLRDDLELEKIKAEIRNISADTERIRAETQKIRRETFLYPIIVLVTGVGAFVAFLRLLG